MTHSPTYNGLHYFELAVHVGLNQDEITEEQIKYEPKKKFRPHS